MATIAVWEVMIKTANQTNGGPGGVLQVYRPSNNIKVSRVVVSYQN